MGSPTVREQPSAYNTFRLDGEASPGISELQSGDAREEIQDQRQMLSTGANTVVQYSKNAVLKYELTLWEIDQLEAWNRWEAMFLQGRQKRPPRIYELTDLRCSWVTRVVFEAMGPQVKDKPGGPWKRSLELHQWTKIAPYGGPIKPGYLDGKIKELEGKIADQRGVPSLAVPVGSVPPGVRR